MNIVLMTSQKIGSASDLLINLINSNKINVKLVIISENKTLNKVKFFKSKIKKILNIGIIGAIIGFHMRSWYTTLTTNNSNLKNVEQICIDNGIYFIKVKSVNSNKTYESLKKLRLDLGVSSGNGYISSKIFKLPKMGFINIHHEILPDFQNAQSIIWQIYNNSNNTGFTIHKINKKIDEGDILVVKKIKIKFYSRLSQTVSNNYLRLWKKSSIACVDVIEKFSEYNFKSKVQGTGKKYTTPNFSQFLKIYLNHRRMYNTYK